MIVLWLALALAGEPEPTQAAPPTASLSVERVPMHPMLDRYLREVGGAVQLPTRVETSTATLVQGPSAGTVLVLTCHHALAGAASVRVRLPDGSERLVPAAAWWVAPHLDLAGTTVATSVAGLAMAEDWPAPGTPLHAWGMADGGPLSARHGTSAGLVSTAPPGTPEQTLGLTTAAIAPGMSGGPVVDDAGALVGIVVAGTTLASRWRGQGMVLPVDAVRDAIGAAGVEPRRERLMFTAEADVASTTRVARALGLVDGDQIVAVSDHTGPPLLLGQALAERPGAVVVQRADGTSIVVPK